MSNGCLCLKAQMEKRNIFSERGHSLNSDEEEDGYESPHARRRGASVDEFLRGSELGRHVRQTYKTHTHSHTCMHIDSYMHAFTHTCALVHTYRHTLP